MNGCVNKNKEFYSLAKEHGIDGGELELIIHKYWNEGGKVDSFPSTLYISEQLGIGKTYYESGENVRKLWERDYSEPIIVNSESELSASVAKAKTFFPADAITTYKDNKGNFVLRVAEPVTSSSIDKEIQDILAKASRDGQGRLLAPNGKLSNLTERQYAQVRTKAFKEWFGDWENNPSEASKVVDKNGEPLVVYHGTNAEFTVFDTSKNDSSYKGFYFTDSKEMAGSYKGDILMPVFLNIRDYYKVNAEGKNWNNINTSIAGSNSSSPLEWLRNIVKQNSLELEAAKRGHYDDFAGRYIKDEKRVKQVQDSLNNLGVTELYNEYENIANSSPSSIIERAIKYFKLKTIEHKAAKLFNNNYYRYQTTSSVHTRDLEVVFSDRDGIIINDVIDYGSRVNNPIPSNVYIVYNPNQIKSATDNIGTFSTTDNNINHDTTSDNTISSSSISYIGQEEATARVQSFIDSIDKSGEYGQAIQEFIDTFGIPVVNEVIFNITQANTHASSWNNFTRALKLGFSEMASSEEKAAVTLHELIHSRTTSLANLYEKAHGVKSLKLKEKSRVLESPSSKALTPEIEKAFDNIVECKAEVLKYLEENSEIKEALLSTDATTNLNKRPLYAILKETNKY